jgi:hypothetical protein
VEREGSRAAADTGDCATLFFMGEDGAHSLEDMHARCMLLFDSDCH